MLEGMLSFLISVQDALIRGSLALRRTEEDSVRLHVGPL